MALENLVRACNILVIAHRLSTIRQADFLACWIAVELSSEVNTSKKWRVVALTLGRMPRTVMQLASFREVLTYRDFSGGRAIAVKASPAEFVAHLFRLARLDHTRPMKKLRVLSATATLALVGLSWSKAAQATWTVVAVDVARGEVGVAGASCIGGVEIVAGIVPGVGAIAAQAAFNQEGRDLGVMLLQEGKSAQEIIDALRDSSFDPGFQNRQYGVATLKGDSAAFTGTQCMDWAGDKQGSSFVVTAQGNILTQAGVVEDAVSSFEAGHDCPYDLADRLMDALQAGSDQGGDGRCSAEQAALSAFIVVAKMNDEASAPFLKLLAPEQTSGGDNPVTLLREQFTSWRQDHPADDADCDDTTSGTDSQSDTSTDTSTTSNDPTSETSEDSEDPTSQDDSTSDDSATSTTGSESDESSDATSDDGSGDPSTDTDESTADDDDDADNTDEDETDADEEGGQGQASCACHAPAASMTWTCLLGLGLLWRRNRLTDRQ